MNKAVKRRGFTVVELVIVIAVIAVLAAVLIHAFGNAVEKARESAAVQEAAGAYTEYLIESAAGGNTAEYVFYKTENKVVVLKNGASMGVYETDKEALKAAFDNPETSEDESAGCALSALGINGLYFMQGSVQAGCGHSYNSVVTPPTCQSGGYTTHTCTLCGDEYTDSETAVSSEHTYTDNVCICGKIKPGTVVGTIGVTTDGGKSFELISTEVTGIYEAIIENNSPTNNNIFRYETSQFTIADIPETKGYRGVYLKVNSGSAVSGSIVFDRNHGTNDIKLEPWKVYRLIIDFTNKTWRIEEIE
ncbi:MAG: type II secretion system protein [Clostridia bacterium]|nr:type II secretion system protein [Clostridia bacterium]